MTARVAVGVAFAVATMWMAVAGAPDVPVTSPDVMADERNER